jgi:multiple sugar transport system permease protein
MPISIGLFQFFGRNEVLWNQLMAASLLSILPVVALFAVLQRRIVGGLTAGGVKG